MPTSQAAQQATAMINLIGSVSGVPGLIQWRKTDVLHPDRGDPDEAVIISGGDRRTGPDRAMEGSVMVEYLWQISVYARETPDVAATDDRPLLVEQIKKALAVSTLPGVSKVWDFEVTPHSDWGIPSFREGIEVNRFGILYRTWEYENSV